MLLVHTHVTLARDTRLYPTLRCNTAPVSQMTRWWSPHPNCSSCHAMMASPRFVQLNLGTLTETSGCTKAYFKHVLASLLKTLYSPREGETTPAWVGRALCRRQTYRAIPHGGAIDTALRQRLLQPLGQSLVYSDPQECTQGKCIYAAKYTDGEKNINPSRWEGSNSGFTW